MSSPPPSGATKPKPGRAVTNRPRTKAARAASRKRPRTWPHFAPGFELADRVEELGPVLALDVELGLDARRSEPFGVFLEEGEDAGGCQRRSFQ